MRLVTILFSLLLTAGCKSSDNAGEKSGGATTNEQAAGETQSDTATVNGRVEQEDSSHFAEEINMADWSTLEAQNTTGTNLLLTAVTQNPEEEVRIYKLEKDASGTHAFNLSGSTPLQAGGVFSFTVKENTYYVIKYKTLSAFVPALAKDVELPLIINTESSIAVNLFIRMLQTPEGKTLADDKKVNSTILDSVSQVAAKTSTVPLKELIDGLLQPLIVEQKESAAAANPPSEDKLAIAEKIVDSAIGAGTISAETATKLKTAISTIAQNPDPTDSPTTSPSLKVTDQQDVTVAEDTATTINFSVEGASASACLNVVSLSSSNPSLVGVEGISVSGDLPSCTATITPKPNQSGTATINIKVSQNGKVAQDSFVLTVAAVNDAPQISVVATSSTLEDTPVVINFSIADVDSPVECAAVTATSNNQNAVENPAIVISGSAPNCVATVTPKQDASGVATITLSVFDGELSSAANSVLTITAVNDAPTISDSADLSGLENEAAVVNFTIADVDSTLTCAGSVSATSSNQSVIANAGIVITGTAPLCVATISPLANQVGVSTLTLSVTDTLLQAQDSFTLTVNAPPGPTAKAAGMLFYDLDTSSGEIEGTLTILKAVDESDMDSYVIYWGSDRFTKNSPTPIATIAKAGANRTHAFGANTSIPSGATFFLVFTENAQGESPNAVSLEIGDVGGTEKASGLSFYDTDLQPGEIQGNAVIHRATDETSLTHYALYWGSDATTKLSGSPISTIAKSGSDLVHTFAANTAIPSGATFLLVYTRDGATEMGAGIAVAIRDKADRCDAADKASATYTLGAGTRTDPFVICNVTQLQKVNDNLAANYVLGTDIDASATTGWSTGTTGTGFIPLGSIDSGYDGIVSANGFSGTFDGKGFSVNGLFISRARDGVGLFGKATHTATIRDLRLLNLNITGTNSVGGVVGQLEGNLSNIYVSGSVTGTGRIGGVVGHGGYLEQGISIDRIRAAVTVTCTGGNCGGIAGYLEGYAILSNSEVSGTVGGTLCTGGATGYADGQNGSNLGILLRSSVNVSGTSAVGGMIGCTYGPKYVLSSATGTVTGTAADVGGFVGSSNFATYENSYATGQVSGVGNSGGFVGNSYGETLVKIYATGAVNGGSGNNVGAVAGSFEGVMSHAFASGTVSGSGSNVGGPIGSDNSSTLTNVHDTTDPAPFRDRNHAVYNGALKWDFSERSSDGIHDLWSLKPNALPTISRLSDLTLPFTGSGTPEDPFVIGTVAHFNELSTRDRLLSAHYKLSDDVDFSSTTYTTIGGDNAWYASIFTGSINGNGHRLTNITTSAGQTRALFASGAAARLTDLRIESATFNGNNYNNGGLFGLCVGCYIENVHLDAAVSGSFYTGGFIGHSSGSTISRSSTAGTVSSSRGAGGIIGRGSAQIYDSYSTMAISAGAHGVGGIAGLLSGDTVIENSYATGAVSNGGHGTIGAIAGGIEHSSAWLTIRNCFSTGTVTSSGTNVGGLLGFNAYATITNSLHNTTASTFYNANHSVYTGTPAWDFVNIWNAPATSLPTLK